MVETLIPLLTATEDKDTAHLDKDVPWTTRYEALGLGNLSPTAQAIVREDADYIAARCIIPPDMAGWPSTRVRTGIVVGAVQSGKTASMLAVSARLLDRGLDILVVLAGTRIALWRQTYERLLEQLDGTDRETFRARRKQRLIIPHPEVLLDAEVRPGATTYMAGEVSRFKQALRHRRPVIIVIPKVEDHLLAVSKFLEDHLLEEALSRTIEMVVLDDEADDGSVLDADVKKIIPRRIEMLWTGRPTSATMASGLHATYVAYTATPQANILQTDHNPLAPRDFCAALRAPYKNGPMKPRFVTFHEPLGLPRYYCGGEFFYVELANTPGALVRALPFPDAAGLAESDFHAKVRAASDTLLLEALRAYLVGAALRLHFALHRGALTYSACVEGVCEADASRFPEAHTMLVHPSAKLELHSMEAWRVVLLSRGIDPDAPNAPELDVDELRLSKPGLAQSLQSHPEDWRCWVERYQSSRNALDLLPGSTSLYEPSTVPWTELTRLLLDEIVPNVRISIINSNPDSDDRPHFSPVVQEDGTILPPPDLLTIFVSGNVMSRGITIEGLHTSVFTRPSDEPAADTQMQMQRWFGYRGSNAHLCRLFCFEDQLQLFQIYHEHDVALRSEILAAMDAQEDAAPHMVLTGSRSLATAKVKTTRLPLHPGPSPFVRLLETGDLAEHNARHLDSQSLVGTWTELRVGRSVIGEIRGETASLVEVAELLEAFRYSHHDPDLDGGTQYTRWRSLERQLGIEAPLFRPPGERPGAPAVDVKQCPYSIAAYLRLWSEALKRPRCDGLYASDSEGEPWAMVQPSLREPKLYVGIRYGSAEKNGWSDLGLLQSVRAMIRGTQTDEYGVTRLNASWGSRGRSGDYLGDQLFDYHVHGYTAPTQRGDEPLWRPRGHPGLLLFQVVQTGNGMRDGVTVGLALPHGGPEQFAAIPKRVKP